VNDWGRIRAYYRANAASINDAGRDSWGVEPYSWETEAGIRFTPIEQAIWQDIRSLDAVLYPQFPVGRRFVDFGNPVAKVAIECDGAAFHLDQKADRQRQAEIESYGWTVYRFTGRECMTDEHERMGETAWETVQGEAFGRLRKILQNHGMANV
jgi:very-short-patch-repair endonuclease